LENSLKKDIGKRDRSLRDKVWFTRLDLGNRTLLQEKTELTGKKC